MGGVINPAEQKRIDDLNNAMWNKLDHLIHQVFEQNPQGQELLELWKDSLIMHPSVTASSTQFEAGIAEGKKEFIRNLILTIRTVEG